MLSARVMPSRLFVRWHLALGLGSQRNPGNRDQGNLSVLYNCIRRGSNGRHADERRDGVGVGASYEHFSSADQLGWSLGARADLFALRIDFRDGAERGHSDVTVLQPTVGAGYTVPVDGGRLRIRFGLDLGTEINVRTRGSAVGEGAILLFGIGLSSPQVGRK